MVSFVLMIFAVTQTVSLAAELVESLVVTFEFVVLLVIAFEFVVLLIVAFEFVVLLVVPFEFAVSYDTTVESVEFVVTDVLFEVEFAIKSAS